MLWKWQSRQKFDQLCDGLSQTVAIRPRAVSQRLRMLEKQVEWQDGTRHALRSAMKSIYRAVSTTLITQNFAHLLLRRDLRNLEQASANPAITCSAYFQTARSRLNHQ
jgi:hypothetical protein